MKIACGFAPATIHCISSTKVGSKLPTPPFPVLFLITSNHIIRHEDFHVARGKEYLAAGADSQIAKTFLR